MDKKEEANSKKNAADQKKVETEGDDKGKDGKKEPQEDGDGEVIEKFGDPDYSAIAPNGEFDLYKVSLIVLC